MSLTSLLGNGIGIELSRTEEPFTMDHSMEFQAQALTRGLSQEAAQRSLFKWMANNIDYDRSEGDYRNAREVFRDMQGICASMTYLYIAMARFVGIPARLARVYVDLDGFEVNHGCIHLPKNVLTDLVIPMYDCHHQKYEVWTDAQVIENFEAYRGNQPPLEMRHR